MNKIAIVGEAWGKKEEEAGRPFVGGSGWLLTQLLSQVGLDRRNMLVTNVFNFRPTNNEVLTLYGKAEDGVPGLPSIQRGKFLKAKFASELSRLYQEINNAGPNLILALGATAAWAFLDTMGIKGIRGAVATSERNRLRPLNRSYKVLPTYHPAAVMRQWELRPTVLADFDKAKREAEFPEVRRPRREIWLEPTLADLEYFQNEHIFPSDRLSADIETIKDQITCIGFAPDPGHCIVIPFYSALTSGHNYWKSKDEELIAWSYVRRWLAEKPTLFQNGMYDISFLWKFYRIPVPKAAEDTMLLHHAWQPELEKGLGYLGSIYTDEASWKYMRKGMKHD